MDSVIGFLATLRGTLNLSLLLILGGVGSMILGGGVVANVALDWSTYVGVGGFVSVLSGVLVASLSEPEASQDSPVEKSPQEQAGGE